jgi:hypothetical protein
MLLLWIIPIDAVLDRDNYLNMASDGWSEVILLTHFLNGYFALFFNEPLWLLLNMVLSKFLEPELIISIIIFLSSFFTFRFLLKKNTNEFHFILLFFLFPQIMKNYVIHLRQGFGLLFYITAYYSISSYYKRLGRALAMFIHSSFIILILIELLNRIIERFTINTSIRIIIYFFIGLISGLSILFFAQLSGARQGEQYTEFQNNSSGLAFIFWFIILLIIVLQGKKYIEENGIVVFFIIFYLMTYFTTPLSGRIFESAMLIVLIACLRLTNWRLFLYKNLILCYGLIQVLLALNKPFLGWGI